MSVSRKELSVLPICKLKGCSKPVHQDETRIYDYCCRSHYKKDIYKGGISERSRYRTPGPKHRPLSGGFDCNSIGCQDGYTQFLSTLPAVRVQNVEECRIIAPSQSQCRAYCKEFLKKWEKLEPPPQDSISVYMITNKALMRKWENYKSTLSLQGSERYYHGTRLCCDLASLQLCRSRSCGICGIAQNGFDKSLMGTNISRFQRFGEAFYLAPHSSKSHDYTIGHGEVRAMLCFDTLPGRKYNIQKTDENFRLPAGYDSAYGVPGVSLNYPELMLYNTAAALPICIITYKKDGIKQIAQ